MLIQSNLKKILMLDTIFYCDDNTISGKRQFQGEQRFCAIEACAQICAMHVRRRNVFNCHAFLLSISSVKPLPPKRLNGMGQLFGRLKGISQQAFSYDVKFQLENTAPSQVKLTIGTKEYGEMFKQEKLRQHYQQLFSSLGHC